MKFFSSFFFAFEAQNINQWRDVDEIECELENDSECLYESGQDILDYYAQDQVNINFSAS